MLVTCKLCKRKIEKDTAYKVTTVSPTTGKKTNTYYCSDEEYQAEEDRKKKYKEDKDRVYYLISDMFGYEIQNQKFFDEWARWNKLKSNAEIYEYLRANEEYLQQMCDKSFNSEAQRIMYFSAILKNHLRDFKPKVEKVEAPKPVVVEEQYETKYKKKTRQALENLEDEE